jgi:uncharacterized lipoprotein YddW (UPF0748 family)
MFFEPAKKTSGMFFIRRLASPRERSKSSPDLFYRIEKHTRRFFGVRYGGRMRRVFFVLGLACGLVAAIGAPAPSTYATAAGDVRGLWVQRTSLVSRESILKVIRTATENGFNTLLVQVRGRGEAFYASDLEPRASDLDSGPAAFDPLATLLDLARAAHLKVHAWVNVNLVASGTTLPRSRSHIAVRHPDWLMAPRALAASLRETDPRSPGYLGTLSRWTRTNSATVEGLFLSPLIPAAQDYTVSVIDELLKRYAVDGLHLDYIRFPNAEFDYSAAALAEFRTSVLPQTPGADRERLDRAAAADPAAWTTARAAAWATFRRDRVTALVTRIAASARAIRPGLTISAAVAPSPTDARDHKMQDWRGWTAAKLLDVVCPMIYTTESENFAAAAATAIEAAGPAAVWAGIGAYRLPVARTAENVRTARRLGAAGIVLFSYDNLVSEYFASLRPVLLESAAPAGPRR